MRFGEKLIYKTGVEPYMQSLAKRGSSWTWYVLIIVIVTLVVAVMFFVILKDRIGGLVHL